jgi:hypothetical protein
MPYRRRLHCAGMSKARLCLDMRKWFPQLLHVHYTAYGRLTTQPKRTGKPTSKWGLPESHPVKLLLLEKKSVCTAQLVRSRCVAPCTQPGNKRGVREGVLCT